MIKQLSKKEVINRLKYIADSPSQQKGGFHPETIKTAKAAIKILEKTKRKNAAKTN
jgi:hypothetical protein